MLMLVLLVNLFFSSVASSVFKKFSLGKISFVLVMLANFNKTENDLETDTDRWLFALKDERMASGKLKINPFKDVSDIVKLTSNNKALGQFYAELHTSSIGRDCLKEFEEKIQESNERLERMLDEGQKMGQKVEAKKTAERMKSLRIDDTIICNSLGISAQELTDLINLLV